MTKVHTICGTMILALFTIACGENGVDQIVALPTVMATAAEPPPPTNTPEPVPPTNTVPPTATLTPSHTPTGVVNFAATDTPIPSITPTLAATERPSGPLVALLQSGDVVSNTLTTNQVDLFVLDLVRGNPIYLFIRADVDLDVAAMAFERDLVADIESGSGEVAAVVAAQPPRFAADSSGVSFPEMLAIVPRLDGPHTVAVSAAANTVGTYRIYAFDVTTESEHLPVALVESFEPNETKTFELFSNGGKPVAVFANPLEDANIRVVIRNTSRGDIIMDANFGGNGSIEKAFVLPRATVGYTIEVSEISGQTTDVELIIAAVADSIR